MMDNPIICRVDIILIFDDISLKCTLRVHGAKSLIAVSSAWSLVAKLRDYAQAKDIQTPACHNSRQYIVHSRYCAENNA